MAWTCTECGVIIERSRDLGWHPDGAACRPCGDAVLKARAKRLEHMELNNIPPSAWVSEQAENNGGAS